MYVCMYVCMYVYVYECMYVCMYVCVFVCMYVCMYVCMCVFCYIYIVYCLFHYSGNTTSFTFLWLFYVTRFNNLTALIATYYKLHIPFDCCILSGLTFFYGSLCDFSGSLKFLCLFYLARFNNRTFLCGTILWALLSFD